MKNAPKRWWHGLQDETAWLEVTRRKDIGVNLKAPQSNESDENFWGYTFITEVNANDRIIHYDGNAQTIVASSIATGKVWSDQVIWAARGLSARSAGIEPHVRAGWYLGLERFQPLKVPITLAAIRTRTDEIKAIHAALTQKYGEPLYFPFEIGQGRRPIRPAQGYLFKLPISFLQLFQDSFKTPPVPPDNPSPNEEIGDDYRKADELLTLPTIDPFKVDPALVERGNRGHAATQNRLAEYLTSIGISPRSPRKEEPNFDIAWRSNGCVFVAEVKSLTNLNEEKQLRLGLGQVLRYAHKLSAYGRSIAVLVLEREPNDPSWIELCTQLGIVLTWPNKFASSQLQ